MKFSAFYKSIAYLSLILLLGPSLAHAQVTTTVTNLSNDDTDFNPNYVLSDGDLLDIQGMTRDRIQNFLDSKGSLGSYKAIDIDGKLKPAADIIWRVAASYQINPRYLLALMQKEQSLVEGKTPDQKAYDWATGFGVCDGCRTDDSSVQTFKGFANQLEFAAKQNRERYLMQMITQGKTLSGYAPGRTAIIDGIQVTPMNTATAMLYSYTPHLHGNLNLWRIWRRWFSLQFPEGSLVYAQDSKNYYLIRLSKKRLVKSKAVAASLTSINKIIDTSETSLSAYPLGTAISFPNYSIIETSDGKKYLINGDKKRFVTDKAFRKLGFVEDDVITASSDDIASYTDGPDITEKSLYPFGGLAIDPQNNLWYIENDLKHAIPDKVFLKLYFNQRPVKPMTKQKLDQIKTGDPIKLHDGELVKSSKKNEPSVYVIENGLKRPVPNGDVFTELGWQWKNVLEIPKKLLDTYPTGALVDPYFSLPYDPSEDAPDTTANQQANATTTNTSIATATP